MLNDSIDKLKQLQKEGDSISEFDKYMEEHRKRSARSQELNKPEYYNTIKAKWQIDYIDYKGTFLEVAKDHITGENFTDLPSSSYESSQFIGTKKQLNDMLSVLYTKPHNEIKIIGSSFMEEVDVDHDQVMNNYLNSKK
jgi:hypothetical protein